MGIFTKLCIIIKLSLMMFRSVTLAFREFSYYLSEQIKSLPDFCLKQMEKGQLALTGRQGWLPMGGGWGMVPLDWEGRWDDSVCHCLALAIGPLALALWSFPPWRAGACRVPRQNTRRRPLLSAAVLAGIEGKILAWAQGWPSVWPLC